MKRTDVHGHHHHACSTLHPPPGLHKRRELRFAGLPPGQTERARQLLEGLENLTVVQLDARSLIVEYEVTEYTLAGLEEGLIDQGFHLESSLLNKILSALAHYCEETQLRNLQAPERLLKKSSQAYVHAWEQHPHGDRDDRPMDLREFR